MAYVAAGRFDGYWERGIHAWDIAAGAVLVREAGGFVGAIDEGAHMFGGAVIAGNEALFDPFRKVIRGE